MNHPISNKLNISTYSKANIIFIFALLTFVTPAQRARSREIWLPDTNSCNQLPTTIDVVNCINLRTKVWDLRLNEAWRVLLNMLQDKGNQGQYLILKTSQQLWIEYRDANCRFYGAEQGTISQIDSAECMRRMTQDRAIELQQSGPQA